MAMLPTVVPAGMLKVTVSVALHGAGAVLPDGQTLTLPKLTACAEAVVETNAKAISPANNATLSGATHISDKNAMRLLTIFEKFTGIAPLRKTA
jgi:hypothetical protein